ncbi:MAG: class I tRNA ligase family protein, partial [Nitrospinota bacterium]
MSNHYNFKGIEKKWQDRWDAEKSYRASIDKDRPKYYLLEMFPYPSGKLHVGHLRNYTIGDAIGRKKRMDGFNLLHPMGWDAFGMPAENAAIENKTDPDSWTKNNINQMRNEFKKIGASYDWDRELMTADPKYYKWTQSLFAKLFDAGLAYKKKSKVNWCESCHTVLANEQVIDNKCWRCQNIVSTVDRDGWFLRITDFADDLLDGLKKLEHQWPERVLLMQKNWIGKSVGANVFFPVVDSDAKIEVFTTRPDTLFGVTFLALSIEHPAVSSLVNRDSEEFIAFSKTIDSQLNNEKNRGSVTKLGFFTGRYALNPLTGENIPIWIANFVLIEYGLGAIMSVPAHDMRDFEFAKKYDIPINIVIVPNESDNIVD